MLTGWDWQYGLTVIGSLCCDDPALVTKLNKKKNNPLRLAEICSLMDFSNNLVTVTNFSRNIAIYLFRNEFSCFAFVFSFMIKTFWFPD